MAEKFPNYLEWVYKHEDHITHFPIHIEERLSAKYENYTENQKKALDVHIEATFQMIIQLQMEIARAQSPQEPERPTPEESAEEPSPGEQL